ncbi:MAG: ABC transporter ATP-binding protein [Archaeoglobaceae archaeon]|nr:ABC transporter ATP-binding protein [Archaeoglobaceae archaeon]MDW8118236.1 ABC transporter ATP-binding protein [Archaeoglobaceae archaeon]
MVEFAVELDGVSKSYSNFEAVRDLKLKIRKGEFFSILGPSGSGKTTILRLIAGLLYPDKGSIRLMGEEVTFVPPYKRNVGMVFQELALFPHLNVFENVAYGLKVRKVPEVEIKKKVKECLEIVNLDPETFGKRKINQLSGGQQQRVAIARALAVEPSVLLLDEPLGSLDLKLRQHMMSELKRIQKTVKTTFVYVTHDQSEALIMSERIAVINKGSIEQVGTPAEIYEAPTTKFVAEFIGEMNFIPAEVYNGGLMSEIGYMRVSKLNGAKRVVVAIRPEKIKLGCSEMDNVYNAVIEEVAYLGGFLSLKARINGISLKCLTSSDLRFEENQRVELGWRADDVIVFEA